MVKCLSMSILILFFTSGLGAVELTGKDTASGVCSSYRPVTAEMNPRVGIAEKIFKRLVDTVDAAAVKFPKLVVVDGKGEFKAEAIKDGSVVLSIEIIDLCFKDASEKMAESRLAFLIAHELGHQARNHLWTGEFYRAFTVGSMTSVKENIRIRMDATTDAGENGALEEQMCEHEADADGIIFMAMAGYDPRMIVGKDGTNFFEYVVMNLTGKKEDSKDSHHPPPRERAEVIRTSLQAVIDYLDYYVLGVRWLQIGAYEKAILFLDRFREKFPSREVFNNLGLAHYQIAMEILAGCDPKLLFRYRLSTMVEPETLAGCFAWESRGARFEAPSCFNEAKFKDAITQSIDYLKIAVSKDPTYIPARVNFSSALIIAGDYAGAMSTTQDILDMEKNGTPGKAVAAIYNNRGVALFQFGAISGMEAFDISMETLKKGLAIDPTQGEILYNIAAGFRERNLNEAAQESWHAMLRFEKTGFYADVARREVGLEVKPQRRSLIHRPVPAPIPLGALSSETRQMLSTLKKSVIPVGSGSAVGGVEDVEAYHGTEMTVYVFDKTVEIIDMELNEPFTRDQLVKKCGEPTKVLRSLGGEAWVYPGFMVDMAAGKAVRIVFYNGSDA